MYVYKHIVIVLKLLPFSLAAEVLHLLTLNIWNSRKPNQDLIHADLLPMNKQHE